MSTLDEMFEKAIQKAQSLSEAERDAFFDSQREKADARAQYIEEGCEWYVVGGVTDFLAPAATVGETKLPFTGLESFLSAPMTITYHAANQDARFPDIEDDKVTASVDGHNPKINYSTSKESRIDISAA